MIADNGGGGAVVAATDAVVIPMVYAGGASSWTGTDLFSGNYRAQLSSRGVAECRRAG